MSVRHSRTFKTPATEIRARRQDRDDTAREAGREVTSLPERPRLTTGVSPNPCFSPTGLEAYPVSCASVGRLARRRERRLCPPQRSEESLPSDQSVVCLGGGRRV